MIGVLFLALRIALALVLYAFLGWGLWTLWLTVRQQVRHSTEPSALPLTLSWRASVQPDAQISEPDRSHGQISGHASDSTAGSPSKVLYFTSPEVAIGRDPACQCSVEDRTISSRHARLTFHHGQWWVEDLQSTNGTFLNEEPVIIPLALASGDELRCGQVLFSIRVGEFELQN